MAKLFETKNLSNLEKIYKAERRVEKAQPCLWAS